MSTAGSTGTMRALLPLPVTVSVSPLARIGDLAALEAERFGDAKARAVEQRHHRGVACEDPGLAFFTGAQVGVGDALGRGTRQRLRQGLWDLGCAHRIERADLALAVALQIAREATGAGQLAHQGAAADSFGPARRHERAHILRGEFRKIGQRGLAAEMVRHK